jgi:micrococcal nuclease
VTGPISIIVGLVIAIADGDTLTVLDNDFEQHKIRLAEIDAPEKRQPFGTRSRQSLGHLCHEKQAEVRVVDVDKYGRIVGRVICDGTDANAAQVRRGLAWVYDRYAKDKTLYRLQDEARAEKQGLWADPQPTAPWDWRKKMRESRRKDELAPAT